MDRDVYLLRARNPFGIDLCGSLGVVAGYCVEIVIDGLIGLVGKQRETACKRVAKESLLEPVNSQTADGVRVHECLVSRLHGDREVRAVVDVTVEIEIDRVDTVLNLLEWGAICRETTFPMGLGSDFR